MTTVQFADHFTDDVVQIQTCLGIWDKHLIFCFDRIPIYPMHILYIETIAISPPCLIKNLRPFLRIIDRNLHIRQVHRITQVCLSRRNIRHIKSITFEEEHFLATGFDTHRSAIGHHVFLLLFQVEYSRTATSPVVNLVSV